MALILRESDVQDLIEMDEVISAVEAAMKELADGDAHNEPRRRAFFPGGLLNVMFAAYPGAGVSGLKAYTVGNGHVRFLVVLFGQRRGAEKVLGRFGVAERQAGPHRADVGAEADGQHDDQWRLPPERFWPAAV